VKQFDAEILENRAVAESWRELLFSWDEAAGEPAPGQFLTLRVSSFSDPLLRRPFAFSAFAREGKGDIARAGVVYQIRGGATRLLSELAPGSRVDLIAPLGKGFPMPGPDERTVLAGGGIGLGPLLYLADRLSRPDRPSSVAPVLVLGVRSAALLPSIALPPGTVICTDDGSSGFRGTPVDIAQPARRGRPRPPLRLRAPSHARFPRGPGRREVLAGEPLGRAVDGLRRRRLHGLRPPTR